MRAVLAALAAALTAATAAEALVPAGAGLKAPAGFRADVYATGVTRPTALALDDAGRVWATSADGSDRPTGKVLMIARAGATPRTVVSGLRTPLGLTWFRGELYVSSTGRVDAYTALSGGRFGARRAVVTGLPVGRHQNDAIVPGPDGRLYLGLGSPCDKCAPASPRSATVLSMRADGSDVRVVARGLRNPYGLAFVPGRADLLVSDEGRDDLGLGAPPEELNLVRTDRAARHYGYPGCWGQGGRPCLGREPALVRLPPHSAAGAVAVIPGRLGPFTAMSAFVTEYGSSFRPPTGRQVVRVALVDAPGGYRASAAPFATGFANPLALVATPGGALLVGDFTRGTIYRIRPR